MISQHWKEVLTASSSSSESSSSSSDSTGAAAFFLPLASGLSPFFFAAFVSFSRKSSLWNENRYNMLPSQHALNLHRLVGQTVFVILIHVPELIEVIVWQQEAGQVDNAIALCGEVQLVALLEVEIKRALEYFSLLQCAQQVRIVVLCVHHLHWLVVTSSMVKRGLRQVK